MEIIDFQGCKGGKIDRNGRQEKLEIIILKNPANNLPTGRQQLANKTPTTGRFEAVGEDKSGGTMVHVLFA